jgi:hypothetical protein
MGALNTSIRMCLSLRLDLAMETGAAVGGVALICSLGVRSGDVIIGAAQNYLQ